MIAKRVAVAAVRAQLERENGLPLLEIAKAKCARAFPTRVLFFDVLSPLRSAHLPLVLIVDSANHPNADNLKGVLQK